MNIFNEIGQLDSLIQTCLSGFSMSVYAEEMVRVARSGADTGITEAEALSEEEAKSFRELRNFAKAQEADGFPAFYQLATVRLWSILEAYVDHAVRARFMNPAQLPDNAILAKLQGPLLGFLSATAEQRAEHLASELKNQVRSPLLPGVARFEKLLDAVGLGGGVDAEVRRALLELGEVRNAVVHRSARVDSRLMERCPWLNVSVGEAIHTRANRYKYYSWAARWYGLEVNIRSNNPDGDAARSRAVKLQEKIALDLLRSRQPAST